MFKHTTAWVWTEHTHVQMKIRDDDGHTDDGGNIHDNNDDDNDVDID